MTCNQIDTNEWTTDRHGISRLWYDGIEYVVIGYEQFASTTLIGAHRSARRKGETTFLVSDCIDGYPHHLPGEELRFWNCGTVERAVLLSKLYVTADAEIKAEMRRHHQDISKLDTIKFSTIF